MVPPLGLACHRLQPEVKRADEQYNPSVRAEASFPRGRTDGWRAAVVAEAASWIGTPFHHAARVKGREGGVDCLMLLAEVYERAGVSPHIAPPFYVPDWHLHRDAEHYLQGLLRYTAEIDAPQPGDIALFKFGRAFSHGAIVTVWPRLVHAYWGVGVVPGDAALHPLKSRPVRFFTPFHLDGGI